MTILDSQGFVAIITTFGGMATTYGAILLNARVNRDNQKELQDLRSENKRLKKGVE